jgi:hypothetical protein
MTFPDRGSRDRSLGFRDTQLVGNFGQSILHFLTGPLAHARLAVDTQGSGYRPMARSGSVVSFDVSDEVAWARS